MTFDGLALAPEVPGAVDCAITKCAHRFIILDGIEAEYELFAIWELGLSKNLVYTKLLFASTEIFLARSAANPELACST